MKSAKNNADPYTKFSKGGGGGRGGSKDFCQVGEGVETSSEHWNCFTVIIDNKLLIILTFLCCQMSPCYCIITSYKLILKRFIVR